MLPDAVGAAERGAEGEGEGEGVADCYESAEDEGGVCEMIWEREVGLGDSILGLGGGEWLGGILEGPKC